MRWQAIVLLMALLLLPAAAGAAPCMRLNAAQKAQAKKLFATTYPYECCDETLDRCLQQKKVCKVAKRLRDDICRRVMRGQDAKAIRDAMSRRARSMTPTGKKAAFDLSGSTPAGAPAGKVQVVVYACARCPFCSKVVPDLYRMATRGGLKGKVTLHFRAFPIRGHKGSLEGGMAFIAAEKLKKFWPYILKVYANFDRFSVENLGVWAGEVGLD